MTILLTGHTGFVGQALFKSLPGRDLRLVGRRAQPDQEAIFFKKELNLNEDFKDCLGGVNAVIHAAARAHIMNDDSLDPLTEYRRVNVDGTLNLAKQAANSGVKRFIYISSIKVNGESTVLGKPFRFDDTPSPEDPYGLSKAEAEAGLLKIGAETGMEIVIIRPPLVYGKGVKGNFASLLKFTPKRLPLPLGCINNKRSMVFVQNLVDLIVTCIDHPCAANQVFLVSDDEDLSTSDLLSRLGNAARCPARLINIPVGVFVSFP
jgi:UDP-glucose 4-epimerase